MPDKSTPELHKLPPTAGKAARPRFLKEKACSKAHRSQQEDSRRATPGKSCSKRARRSAARSRSPAAAPGPHRPSGTAEGPRPPDAHTRSPSLQKLFPPRQPQASPHPQSGQLIRVADLTQLRLYSTPLPRPGGRRASRERERDGDGR